MDIIKIWPNFHIFYQNNVKEEIVQKFLINDWLILIQVSVVEGLRPDFATPKKHPNIEKTITHVYFLEN